MMMNKKFALALFASLLVNVFLLGLGAQHWLSRSQDAKEEQFASAQKRLEESRTGRRAGKLSRAGEHAKGGGHERTKGAKEGKNRGPQDLVLLRNMVKVMGGRDDPRVKGVWSDSRSQMQELRRDMNRARKKVHDALTREPFEAEKLSGALSALRDKSNAAQERAQAGVMDLAELLTAEERKALHKMSPRQRRKRGVGRPGGKSK